MCGGGGSKPFRVCQSGIPRPFVFCYTLRSRMAYSASFICQTLDVGSTLIHSSVLYCFALLICITQRKVSSFFLLLHPSLCSVCKGQEERVCCAALFLLLYSVQLRFTQDLGRNLHKLHSDFFCAYNPSLHYIQLHLTSFVSLYSISFRNISYSLESKPFFCRISLVSFASLSQISNLLGLKPNLGLASTVLFFFGTSNPSEKPLASLRDISTYLTFLYVLSLTFLPLAIRP